MTLTPEQQALRRAAMALEAGLGRYSDAQDAYEEVATPAAILALLAQLESATVPSVPDAWWLAEVDSYGTAWTKDGPHSDCAGVAKAKYLFDSMGLCKGGKLVCMAATISEIEGSAEGVNMGALAECNAMGLRKVQP